MSSNPGGSCRKQSANHVSIVLPGYRFERMCEEECQDDERPSFVEYSANGEEYITADEVTHWHSSIGRSPTDEHIERSIRALGTNGDEKFYVVIQFDLFREIVANKTIGKKNMKTAIVVS